MKRNILTICAFLITFYSFGQHQYQQLEKAFKSDSPEKMAHFFDNWKKELPARSTEEINKLNDTVRNIYQVFHEFYNPLVSVRGNEYGRVKYYLVQNNISYAIVDTLDKDMLMHKEFERVAKMWHISADSVIKLFKAEDRQVLKHVHFRWPEPKVKTLVSDFRPSVKFSTPKAVSLTSSYVTLLQKFLNNKNATAAEAQKRLTFLNSYILTWYGHEHVYWQFHSYPIVNSIVFDTTLENALVYYQLVDEGGYAYYKKINGVWTLLERDRTWIA
jgi:hypothetical protein